MNVFLAYLIDNFQSSLYHLEKNRNVHFFILELIYKSSESSSSKIINYAAKIKNKKGLNLIERFAKKTNGEIDFEGENKRINGFKIPKTGNKAKSYR